MALKLLERVRDRPDRHGHTSSDSVQQEIGAKLMHRHALIMKLEKRREKAATYGFFGRFFDWFGRWGTRSQIWRFGATVRQSMANQEFLQNTLAPYRSGGLNIPFPMTGDLIPLLGPAVVPFGFGSSQSQRRNKGSRNQTLFGCLGATSRLPTRRLEGRRKDGA